MITLTKEWLLKTIAELEEERDATPGAVNEDAAKALAAMKLALASLEAEPVAWLYSASFERGHVEGELTDAPGCDMPVYTAPPAPVSVPDVLKRLRSLVADPRALPRRKEWISGQQYSYVLLENVEAMVDDACRAAMLQGADGNSPVIPDGWVMVPFEPTEDMIVNGFESEPDESFSDEKEWEAYDAMSGCQQAAHRAKLCWAAMIEAAPKLKHDLT